MRIAYLTIAALVFGSMNLACKKEKEKGDVSASLMKSETVSASLAASGSFGLAGGSMAQSFTPDSLKIPIFRVSLCKDNSSCVSLYQCADDSVEACGVELSDLDAFVDTLNTSPTEIEEDSTFDHIAVQFCPDGDSSGIQHITLNGTVTIQGTSYATHPTKGLIAGTKGKDAEIEVSGGCASYYPIEPNVTVSKDNPTTVKLFFDASLYAYAGVSGGSSDTESYNDSGSCLGSEDAYVCAQVVTIVPTVDSGDPSTEHYLIANTEEGDDSAATAKVALYYSSEGEPIGGVQNTYRIAGSDITWGRSMDGGLGLYPKTIDASTVSFGEPEGSVSLANWFKKFKRKSHTGTYTYANGSDEAEASYKATKL